MKYFYLHGFASSPRSTKARRLRDQFQSVHLSLEVPDLNQDDFQHLTLTRQIEQVIKLLPEESVTLVGSSFGGLTAAWIAQKCSQVDRVVLLAPAFNYLNYWLPTIAPSQLKQWQSGEPILVYHYGEGKPLPLSYGIVVDLTQYDESELQKSIPTLILHGIRDQVIPIKQSQSYVATRSWVDLIELDSDHSLVDQEESIWQAMQQFCEI